MHAVTQKPQAAGAPRLPHGMGSHDPAPSRSPALAAEIAGHLRHQPDITLGEIGAALVGAGFTCSPDGRLAYEPHHVALIEEVEALIEAHGQGARAAGLFGENSFTRS